MKFNQKIKNFFSTFFFLISLSFLINFFISCNSNETPFQNNEGPSYVMGTYFEMPVEYSAGENPLDIVFGNFNIDNSTDIIVTSPSKQIGTSIVEDGTMTLFLNDSSSSSSFPYESIILNSTVSEWRQDVASTDFSGDNVSDLIVTLMGQESIKFLKNDGSANFSDNGSVNVGKTPLKIVTGDWDSDNQTDIAVVNRDNSSVSIINNSGSNFSLTQTLIVEEQPVSITAGDWNGDTHEDLAVLSRSSNFVQILINNGSGLFSVQNTTYSVGVLPFEMISGDWNCDSKKDLAITNSGEDTLSLIYGKGTGDFETTINISTGRGPRAINVADFNNDNKMDFVIGHQFLVGTQGLSLLTGDFSITLSDNSFSNGYGTHLSFAATLTEKGASPAELLILDVDNDSKLDILATLPANKKLVLLSGKQFFGSLSCP